MKVNETDHFCRDFSKRRNCICKQSAQCQCFNIRSTRLVLLFLQMFYEAQMSCVVLECLFTNKVTPF